MIYIDENITKVHFPNLRGVRPKYIEFTNQVTKSKFTVQVKRFEMNSLYYEFDLSRDISKFTNGQYDYTLYDIKGYLLGTGILQFGKYEPDTRSYSNNNEIIQYNG